jgi:hypothetical protein
MPTPLMKRFGSWLGSWRGACDFSDGRAGVMQFTLTSIFLGEAIQVDVISFDETGTPISRGWGYLSLDRRGRVVNNCYGNRLGFAVLTETPDDPDVLSLAGQLPGNMKMDVTMSVSGDVFTLSSFVHEGYRATDDRPRTYMQMHRFGLSPRPAEETP